MKRTIHILAVAIALVPPSTAQASKVKVWSHNAPPHYEKAQWKHTVVSNEGAVRLSRQLKPLVKLRATHVWDIVEDRAGNLYVATGDEGKLYRVSPDGKVSVAFESDESQVLCLAAAPDGSIYAGTGPGGLVVRISPDGSARVLYDSPEAYVWSLAVAADGACLYAGTGPKGRIYRISPEGQGEVFYTTKQEHVLCLATDGKGMLYAGADKGGLVYRIDARGKGFVLYSAPQAEVRSLLVTADGIFAGTSTPTRRRLGGNSAATAERSAAAAGTVAASTTGTTRLVDANSKLASATKASAGSAEESEDSKESGRPTQVPPPAAGENSLYQIRADGTVREVFREKTMLLSMLRSEGRIFVGTGMDGQLFEIDEATRERSEIARLDHGQIHCLCPRRDGSIVVGTGDPGNLYLLHDRYCAKGTVTSEVLDAKLVSKWGALRWHADTPVGTFVSVSVRVGNVAEPDETWSDWSAEQTNPRQAVIAAPAARFLQYRVTLTTERPNVTPSLTSLALRYMTTNQAPEVRKIEVPDLDAVNLENPKKLKLKWQAADANDDDLTYSLFVRKDGWQSWVQLEDNLEKREYEWDTTATPSGTYQLKVVASDRKDNPAEDALSAERVSEPFVVSHTPPTVTLKVVSVDGAQAVVKATAVDPLVRLTAASFAVNGKKWANVFPTDGLFDGTTETFRFKTEILKPGTYVLVLRVSDAAGNTGSGDVVFTVKSEP